MSTILLYLECKSEMCCALLAGNAGPKIAKNLHMGTIAQLCRLYLCNWGTYRQSEKKTFKQQYRPAKYLPHMSSQYGELRPTSGWDLLASLRHPCKFQQFRVLAALLHSTLVVNVSQTLRRWTEGATYIRQGGNDVGHWPTFLVLSFFVA